MESEILILDELINLATKALKKKDMPISAIITNTDGIIISTGINKMKSTHNETAHAEIEAIENAGAKLDKRINPTSLILYTSLEPCPACAFFISQTNIAKVVVIATDPINSLSTLQKESAYYKDLLKNIEFVNEPSTIHKKKSLTLLVDYFTMRGKENVAQIFKNKL